MLRLFFVLTLVCGVIYPLAITSIGVIFFPKGTQGSLVKAGEKIVGSALLAQNFSREDFFHSRPSAANYVTVSSGASQSSPIQKAAKDLREQRRSISPLAGVDAWTASGSGLDPHISPQTAYSQINRVAAARGMTEEALKSLIEKNVEGPTLGIWGRPRVNVLKLNIALLEGKYANARSATRNP